MNTKLPLVLSALIGLGCAGGSPAGGGSGELGAAAAVWARDKPACAPYHYTRAFVSFTGSDSQTGVEITNDRPQPASLPRALGR